jgi:hypothetical protein
MLIVRNIHHNKTQTYRILLFYCKLPLYCPEGEGEGGMGGFFVNKTSVEEVCMQPGLVFV